MKKLIAAAGLGAAVTIGSLVGAGTANASEGSYLQALSYSLNIYSPETAINAGYLICNELAQGYTYSEEAWSLVRGANGPWGRGHYTYADAWAQVAAAHNELCPSVWAYKV